ncbi:hypothetical protein BD413DRAFT_290755 [Trametes elegans]|nr:hypothetical protein BD413DRAFT_290755 [Trametes elegans]
MSPCGGTMCAMSVRGPFLPAKTKDTAPELGAVPRLPWSSSSAHSTRTHALTISFLASSGLLDHRSGRRVFDPTRPRISRLVPSCLVIRAANHWPRLTAALPSEAWIVQGLTSPRDGNGSCPATYCPAQTYAEKFTLALPGSVSSLDHSTCNSICNLSFVHTVFTIDSPMGLWFNGASISCSQGVTHRGPIRCRYTGVITSAGSVCSRLYSGHGHFSGACGALPPGLYETPSRIVLFSVHALYDTVEVILRDTNSGPYVRSFTLSLGGRRRRDAALRAERPWLTTIASSAYVSLLCSAFALSISSVFLTLWRRKLRTRGKRGMV